MMGDAAPRAVLQDDRRIQGKAPFQNELGWNDALAIRRSMTLLPYVSVILK
jgi:hypothetical protein